ncbi:MAG: DUF1800 family protein, partial [Saprospiraceae bacterium]|nr:DUF1800 family protein [Saprospiraceae bacterium]
SEVALFIARKLYRWFVYSAIDTQIEQDIIVPMAEIIRTNDYEIAPALKALLSSEHFYEDCVIGCIIKNPVDFLMSPVNHFNVALPVDLVSRQRVLASIYQLSFAMQMGLFQAPSVAGWQAFYQAPNFYKLWLNATSLPARKGYSDSLGSGGIPVSGFRLQINPLQTLNKFGNPSDADNVIDELSLLMFSKPLASNQKTVLRNTLLAGGTAESWTTIYNTYASDPGNDMKGQQVMTRVRPLLVYMMRMPEFHLS